MRNVDENKYRKRVGRPPWSDLYDTKVDTRITASDDRALNKLAEQYGVTRSTIIRKALHDFIKFNSEDKED